VADYSNSSTRLSGEADCERNTTKPIMSASEISKASTQTTTPSFRPNIAVGYASERLNSQQEEDYLASSDLVIARMIHHPTWMDS
jgi:hypothetical protein